MTKLILSMAIAVYLMKFNCFIIKLLTFSSKTFLLKYNNIK